MQKHVLRSDTVGRKSGCIFIRILLQDAFGSTSVFCHSPLPADSVLYWVGLTVPDRRHTIEPVKGVMDESLLFKGRLNCVGCYIRALGTVQCADMFSYIALFTFIFIQAKDTQPLVFTNVMLL